MKRNVNASFAEKLKNRAETLF